MSKRPGNKSAVTRAVLQEHPEADTATVIAMVDKQGVTIDRRTVHAMRSRLRKEGLLPRRGGQRNSQLVVHTQATAVEVQPEIALRIHYERLLTRTRQYKAVIALLLSDE